MFANSLARGPRRRGIVLVLILGMLGLLALIGVTFATFAGQSLINARNFSISEQRPGAETYFDFALGQLINDTSNPLSAIRGHSLLRDMYGNDSVFRGTTAAEYKGFLSTITQPTGQTTNLVLGNAQVYSKSSNQLTPALANRPQGYLQFQTNIPTAQASYQYYGLNFTRWIVRLHGVTYKDPNGNVRPAVPQTFEVLEDDDTGTDPFSGGNHLLTLSPLDPTAAPLDPKNKTQYTGTYVYGNPALTTAPDNGNGNTDKYPIHLAMPGSGAAFTLDGRFMRAFNGPGMSRPLIPVVNYNNNPAYPPLVPFNVAAYANFKVNGSLIDPTKSPNSTSTFPTATSFGNPDIIGMDEDYDACDLENWFLALQSADGQVMIPSFHRPSILTATDWTSRFSSTNTAAQNMDAVAGVAKILRPRQVDNSPQFPPDPAVDVTTGKVTYDVDNDGDGVTDSVWLDLGYPVQKDAGGKLYKPLFAFMVIGQNGRLPLNTAGNLQDRDSQYSKTYYARNPSVVVDATHPVSPANNPYLQSDGAPATLVASATTPITYSPGANTVQQYAMANTFYDAPTWDHTSHLGTSANEVNPKFILQNAPPGVFSYNPKASNANYVPTLSDPTYSQVDNAGIDVSLTQLRAILAGTVPQDNPIAPINTQTERNFVAVNGSAYYMPNMVIDSNDYISGGAVPKTGIPPVAGRWGEPEGIVGAAQSLSLANTIFANFGNTPHNVYLNPVRAGRSYYGQSQLGPGNSYGHTADALDDDLDSANLALGNEGAAFFDAAGQVSVASERLRRFLTPTDPSGNGQLMNWMNRPNDAYEHGSGYDNFGRVTYFRYFRPPGVPHHVVYPFAAGGAEALAATSPYLVDAYKMAVYSYVPYVNNYIPVPNTTNNQYHSYESFRAPAPNSNNTVLTVNDLSQIAVAGAMPFDVLLNQPLTSTNPGVLWPNVTPSMSGAVNSESGPYLMGIPGPVYLNPSPYTYIANQNGPFLDNANNQSPQQVATVVNGYPLGSLSKDEADEMNLYSPNHYDMQFSPSDLEWLYRKQDVDGSTLNSRLSSLAPVSFLNPADGQTRRRLFGLESWDPNSFIWASDNPLTFDASLYTNFVNGNSTNPQFNSPQFNFNSRFGSLANANFAGLNQVDNVSGVALNAASGFGLLTHFANPNTVEGVPNPLLEAPILSNSAFPADATVNVDTANAAGSPPVKNFIPHPGVSFAVPLPVNGTSANKDGPIAFASADSTSSHYPNAINGFNAGVNNVSAYPIATPALAMRDRRINLNMPLPVASDPAEPVRQKWCRETYQLLKAILPPQAIDTPEELAALSQFVVNIIDFRDPDSTMTRFVNTDLMITQATATTPSGVQFAAMNFPSPGSTGAISTKPIWDPSGNSHTFYPFDPMIAYEQSDPSAGWVSAMTDPNSSPAAAYPLFLVQYGMEYNPIAINEVLAYQWNSSPTPKAASTANTVTSRFYIELVNTLTDDTSHFPTNATAPTPGSGDLDLAGWDFIITPDTDSRGRPDPVTGAIPATAGLIANTAYSSKTNGVDPTVGGQIDNANLNTGFTTTVPTGAVTNWSSASPAVKPPTTGTLPVGSFGWSLSLANGLYNASATPPPNTFPATNTISFIPALRNGGPTLFGGGKAAGTNVAGINQVIGDSYYVLASQLPTGASDPKPALSGNPDFSLPTGFFPVPGTPTQAPGNQYYWLHLRRPANPFNPGNEMVVVDSMRFPYSANTTQGQSVIVPPATTPTDESSAGSTTASTNQIFSSQRLQPYRGGHHVPRTPPVGPTGAGAATPLGHPVPASAWGYSEQTAPGTTNLNGGQASYGANSNAGAGYNIAGNVYATVGAVNSPADSSWEYFPFHDRDFSSVADLLLVPGCSPGLFTKQFVEWAFDFSNVASTAYPNSGPNRFPTMKGTAPTAPSNTGQIGKAFTATSPPPSFPYLNDEFYYTAVSVAPSNDTNDPASAAPYPAQIGGWTGAGWYRMLDFFEVPNSANGAIGPAANGENFDWARSDRRPGLINLNLVIDEEVFFGLIDDQRLNIALAQYGYFLNNTFNTTPTTSGYTNIQVASTSFPFFPQMMFAATLPQVISQVNYAGEPTAFYGLSDPKGAGNAVTALAPGYVTNSSIPSTLNSHLPAAAPIYPNATAVGRGYSYADPAFSYLGFNQNLITGTKAAFADFLKLRHGGTNFLFGHQAPYSPPGTIALVIDGSPLTNNATPPHGFNTVGANAATNSNSVWPDKPYRSLSYPDINYTILRPATPVPPITGVTGTSPLTFPPPYQYDQPLPAGGPPTPSPISSLTLAAAGTANPAMPTSATNGYTGDPGVRFPWMDLTFANMGNYNTSYNVPLMNATPVAIPMIPPIPPRRLFAPPDNVPTTVGGTVSNASTLGYAGLNQAGSYANPYLADPFSELISPVANPLLPGSITTLNYTSTSLRANAPLTPWFDTAPDYSSQPANASTYNPSLMIVNGGPYLGSNYVRQDYTLSIGNRQHPAYRVEMLQKLMNLSTVRTHQFAVWITVGFFEVTRVGTPELGVPDILGAELNAAAGSNVRYRSFFVLDRTKATGFNPYYPGEFRDCVTYRRRIE